MKTIRVMVTALLLAAVLAAPAFAQSGYDLFQKALAKERAEGKLEEAIQLYKQIVKEHAGNRALAAKALVQMGQCYEKLGNSEARKAYERVLRDYADQPEAQQARTRLAALTQPAPPKFSEPVVRQVWAGPNVDTLGAPSSDGKYLSFVDWETGDLALRDLATGENRRLTNKGPWTQLPLEFALQSVPSPDGKQVAYTWFKEAWFDLRVIALDGSAPRTLLSSPRGAALAPTAWSPDGRSILALLGSKENTNQIVWVSVENGSVRVVKTLDWRSPARVSLSPDGRLIVYDFPPKEKFQQRDIFLLAADGSNEVPLVQHPANDFLPVWAPDGKRVVFASDRTGTMGLWSIEIAGGKPQGAPVLLKPDIGRISAMAVTRDGRLYYGLNTGMTDVYVAALDTATGRILEPPAPVSQSFVGANRGPDWSPDGKYLAYLSQRLPGPASAGTPPIVIRTLATGEERELLPAMTTYGRPRWSPDGRAFLIHGRDTQGRKGIYRVDAQTGAATLLIPLEPAAYSPMPAWSADGKKVFYTYPTGQGFGLHMHNLESGEDKVLYSGNALSLAPSPDGQWLAFIHGGQALLVVPLAGGEARELLRPAGEWFPLDGVAWTQDGKYLLFAKAPTVTGQPASLWRIPAQGGEPQNLNLNLGSFGGVSLRLHPDGRRLAFTFGQSGQTTNTSEIWVMENFLPTERAAKGTGPVVRQVWAGPGVDYFGVPSADGRFLPITDWETGDLGIRDLVAGETRRLTNKGSWMQSTEFAMFPVPSPDGKQVAYTWFNKELTWDLRVIGADGSAPRVLYHSPDVEFALPAGWTPDGKYIAAPIIRRDGTSQVVLISVADGSLRVLWTSPATPGGSAKGGLSPDGRFIVYDGLPNPEAKQSDIFLLSVETGKEIPLVQHPANDLFPVWTPDGKAVLFASDRSGTLGLWLQQVVDGRPKGSPELVKADAGKIYPMGFTQKGSFYYGLDTGANDVYTAQLDLPAGKILDAPVAISQRYVGSNSAPTWSPDGKYLAYVSHRGAFPSALGNMGSRVVVIRSVETGKEHDLPVDLKVVNRPLWSPDSRSIIAGGQNNKGNGIFRIDAQTGAVTTLVQEPGTNYRWPALSPDGKTLFYLEINAPKKTWSIRARDLQSGGEKELFSVPAPPGGILSLGLSPDGQQLAFFVGDASRPQEIVLKVMSATGGETRDICKIMRPAYFTGSTRLLWTPDGQAILFVRGGQDPAKPQDQTYELWQVSAAGGEPQRVGLPMGRLRDLSLHPDGKRLAFAAGQPKPEIWVMENFLPTLKAQK